MDANGWSFVAGLEQVFALQPVLACAECVDEFASHSHFKLVQSVATFFGYKTLWAQIVPYHELANHCRSRWLCVWVRADIQAEPLGFSLPCSIAPRVPWNDECYHFHLPKVWRDQVRLSRSEAEIYNDPQMYPPAKRTKVLASTRPDAGLLVRLANPKEPLPTLCASYSAQHVVPFEHLKSKGIFAVLAHQDGSYGFLDPAHFCSLFGTTKELLLPSKLSLAFKVVGNAITVPRSVLCLSVGLYAILPEVIDPVSVMRDAWEHRLTARSALLFEQGPFVHLVPFASARQRLRTKDILPDQGEWRILFALRDEADVVEMRATMSTSFAEVAASFFDGPAGLLQQLKLSSHLRTCDLTLSIRELSAIADEWDLWLGSVCLAKCTFVLQPVRPSPRLTLASELCSPTAPGLDVADLPIDLSRPGSLGAFWSLCRLHPYP